MWFLFFFLVTDFDTRYSVFNKMSYYYFMITLGARLEGRGRGVAKIQFASCIFDIVMPLTIVEYNWYVINENMHSKYLCDCRISWWIISFDWRHHFCFFPCPVQQSPVRRCWLCGQIFGIRRKGQADVFFWLNIRRTQDFSLTQRMQIINCYTWFLTYKTKNTVIIIQKYRLIIHSFLLNNKREPQQWWIHGSSNCKLNSDHYSET